MKTHIWTYPYLKTIDIQGRLAPCFIPYLGYDWSFTITISGEDLISDYMYNMYPGRPRVQSGQKFLAFSNSIS